MNGIKHINMDYEKAYKAVLERARKAYNAIKPENYGARKIIENAFPELRESEDERHRKWILEYLYDGLQKSDEQFKDQFKSAISWLEELPTRVSLSSWKPSEEQMCYLKKVYESYDFCDGERDALESLYNDLKKLGVKEEPEYYQHFDSDC